MFTLIFALLLAPGQPKHVRYIAKRLFLLVYVFVLFCVLTKLCLHEFIAAWYWQGNCLVGKQTLISRLHGLSSSMKLISYFHKQFASNRLYLWSWVDYFLFKSIETKISVVYGE